MSIVGELMSSVREPATPRGLSARQLQARAHVQLARGRGLEIGPLFTPLVHRDEADVRYVDIASADALRAHFADDPAVPNDDIVDIDYVLIDADGAVHSLAEVTRGDAPFAWVLASHVVEHVPDLIGWLRDVAEVLADGGHLSLVVPDCRYTFDVLRPITTVGAMLQAQEQSDTRPSTRAVFDHFSSHVEVSAADLWEGRAQRPQGRTYTLEQTWDVVAQSRAGQYMDSHVWVFTPQSFLDQLETLSRLDLVDFSVAAICPTPPHELEFYVTLARLPRAASAGVRRTTFAADLARAQGSLPVDVPVPDRAEPPAAAEDSTELALSAREQQLILGKRRVLNSTRRAVAGVRRRARSG